jgi:hypothetical protein
MNQERDDDIDERLSRISRATASIRPGPGFGVRVRRALKREQERDLGWAISRAGRPMALLAAVFALGVLVFAGVFGRAADKDIAVSYGMEEIDW